MKVISYGAAKTVTGSAHMLLLEDKKILVDCGLFQGVDEEKSEELGFDPKEVDAVLLTHAHIDHCGRIPMLVKNGFRGKIYCTRPTYELSRLMLLDTAKVMLENYKSHMKRFQRGALKEMPLEPLYDEDDVFEAMEHFEPIFSYDKSYQLFDLKVTPKDAGHILGSCFYEIEYKDRKIIFSGDLGNKGKPIVRDFSLPSKADVVYVESTYGDRLHKSFEESKEELKSIIKDTIKHGNVLIPSYALERTQDILYVLREFYEEGSLPKCKIFLDSPLAIGVTKVFLRNQEYFRKETYEIMQKEDPFNLPYLTMVRDIEESKQINDIQEGAIIIAGSGMLTGGRILHHIRHHAYKEQNAIVFVGYQPHGTLGRRILEKQNPVFVMGEPINVKAKIYTVNGFSSHADQQELIEWINAANPQKICLIHGEEDKMLVLKEKLGGKNVYIPSRKEVVDV